MLIYCAINMIARLRQNYTIILRPVSSLFVQLYISLHYVVFSQHLVRRKCESFSGAFVFGRAIVFVAVCYPFCSNFAPISIAEGYLPLCAKVENLDKFARAGRAHYKVENLVCQVSFSGRRGLGSDTSGNPVLPRPLSFCIITFMESRKGNEMTLADLTPEDREEAEKFWLESQE